MQGHVITYFCVLTLTRIDVEVTVFLFGVAGNNSIMLYTGQEFLPTLLHQCLSSYSPSSMSNIVPLP